jgi:broad specificity phosphatase PhoE
VLEGLASSLTGQDIIMVAHGGTIRAAISHALGLDAHQALSFSVQNLSLTRLEKHGSDWRVTSVNEDPRPQA